MHFFCLLTAAFADGFYHGKNTDEDIDNLKNQWYNFCVFLTHAGTVCHRFIAGSKRLAEKDLQ